MPAWVIDILVELNIASGITLLLFALFVLTPLAFSTFPSVLLFTTLFRIALNVATTRQILLEAHAGEIIDTFGSMVVGGSLLVGLVIFMIITVVQFIVIAKGAERVAEVGARFTLDAMPGKQIAIDSDLRAGLISQAEALDQRRRLGLESQFFGSMDGAMKFVKGDAIASIVIVLVNLLGGIAVGMLANGMGIAEAVATYSVLSIGDGLVTQVPALFISMAAGIVVTRTSDEEDNKNLASQITQQFSSQPRSLMLAGIVVMLFALVPGFPWLTFLLLGAFLTAIGFRQAKALLKKTVSEASGIIPAAAREGDQTLSRVVDTEHAPYAVLAVEFDPELIRRLDVATLNREIEAFRELWRDLIGTPFPGIGFRRNQQLPASTMALLFSETRVLATQVGSHESATDLNRQIVDGLAQMIRTYSDELLGIQETKWLLAKSEGAYPDLVREASKVLELPAMANLLASLVADGIPLRDMRTILEAIVDQGSAIAPPHVVVQRIRLACRRIVCNALVGPTGQLTLLPLAGDIEQLLIDNALPRTSEDDELQWPFEVVEALANGLRAKLMEHEEERPVLLTTPVIRGGISKQLRAFIPSLRVLSHNEIASDLPTKALTALSVDLSPYLMNGHFGLESTQVRA